ncbi:MAG: DNA-3-methyladenine glycosylase, partial [Burkholderiaceae bacterium]
RLLCSGPGRLGQALGITASFDGLPINRAPFELQPLPMTAEVLIGMRIGISKARNMPWRFGLSGSRFVSRPFA